MASMDIDSPSTPSMAITPVLSEDNDETPITVEQPNKRRRKKSIVWEHFTIETVGAGCMRACCKQCKKSFAYITGSKLAGTSHLKRHIALGICPVSRQKNEATQLISGVKSEPPPKRRYRTSPALVSAPFDQDRCNQDVAKMIIQHDYPLHMVEHPAFVDFVRTLQPQFKMVSLDTIQGEIVALYLREKQGLLNLINGLPGRVSISLDMRTSNLNVGYAFLTGHFIDNDWKLHRRLLNVVMLPFPESEYAFNQAVVSCVSDWHLESRLFTLTLDQSVSSDNIVGNLRGLLSVKNQLMFNGQLVKGNCYARVLSRLAQDALGATDEVVRRIRESVKYVKTSDSHDEKFAELRQRLQVPSTRDLIIDDQTKWDTTYHMLVAACELKEVFACLDTTDPVYKINPSMDDWKQVEILCTYLKLLYDAASILTGLVYPPANAFYHEVSKIQLELTHAAMSQDPFVSNLARPLKEKFDQYWRDCFLVLAIAIVMDPRFKMKLVEFSFSRIFGEDAGTWIKIVDDGIHELFLDYLAPNLSVPATYMDPGNASISQSEIFQEAHHPEVAIQDPSFQELQAMHQADLAAQELDSQGATVQELQSEEITTEVQPSGENLQDPSSQVLNHHEVAQQEMPTEEAPVRETQTQELLQDSQEVTKQMDSQSVATQELDGQVEATKEMDSQEATQHMSGQTEPQEMDCQEVSVKEVDSQEAAAQQVVVQDVTMEEMPNTAEVLVHDKHVEGSIEENNKEDVTPEEMLTDERVPAEVQTQETTDEIQAREKETQKMHDQDIHAVENMNVDQQTQEIPTQEADTPVKSTEEVHAQEVSQENTCAQEMHASKVQAPEGLPEGINPAEEQTEELKSVEEPAKELKPAEEQAKELESVEEQGDDLKPAEEQGEELKPTGKQAEEMKPSAEEQADELKPAEKPAEELKPAEKPAEELKPAEEQAEELKPAEEQVEEVKPAEERAELMEPVEEKTEQLKPVEETDESKPDEKQSEEMQPSEMHTEEMQPADVQAEEIEPSERPDEVMQPSVGQTQEMQHEEIQTQEKSEEVQPEGQTQEMQHEEIQTQEKSQEVQPEGQTQEMQDEEAQTQETPPVEEKSQEVQPEGQAQEMHSSEAQTMEMNPPLAEGQEMHLAETQGQETHEIILSEEQAQEKEIDQLQFQEAQTNGMHSQEAEANEVHSQEAETHRMLSQEAESHEMQVEEARAHEMQLQEAENHEMQPEQMQSQDIHFQGVQYHDQHDQAMHNQEMHSQEMQAQGMEYQEMQPHEMHTQDLPLLSIGDGLQDFEVYISEIANSQHLKSELDQYLEESLLPRVQDFDVLGWWKLNKLKYPTLSKMAADILSIPVSTVAPESVFDIRSRKINSYQSSLQPVTLEALVCAKDWLQPEPSASPSDTSNALVRMEY